ncbi:MAG: hypothetical protein ABI743_10500 [bacterium]
MPDQTPPATEIDYAPAAEESASADGVQPTPVEPVAKPTADAAQILKLTPVGPTRSRAKPLTAPDPPLLFVIIQRLFEKDRAA